MHIQFAAETRFLTQQIADKMPMPLQIFLWTAIEDLQKDGLPLDYLQVFTFKKVADGLYAIEHTQEQPDRNIVYYVTGNDLGVENVVGRKVYIIDDGDYSTIMFAEER